jgi:hypothetical protein
VDHIFRLTAPHPDSGSNHIRSSSVE